MSGHVTLFKVLCTGNSGTGKSHFLQSIQIRLQNHKINMEHEDEHQHEHQHEMYRKRTYSVDSTYGVDFFHKYFKINNNFIKIHFWDVSGSNRFKDAMKVYFDVGDCVLYFFNVDDIQSLYDLKTWSKLVHKKRIHELLNKNEDNRYKLVIGNIRDEENRVVSYKNGYKFAKSIGCDYIEFRDNKLDTHAICKKIIQNIKNTNINTITHMYTTNTCEVTLIDDCYSDSSNGDLNTNFTSTTKPLLSFFQKLIYKVLEYANCCFGRNYVSILDYDKEENIYDLSLS